MDKTSFDWTIWDKFFEKEDKLAIIACYNDTEITLRNYVASMLKEFKNLDLVKQENINVKSYNKILKEVKNLKY